MERNWRVELPLTFFSPSSSFPTAFESFGCGICIKPKENKVAATTRISSSPLAWKFLSSCPFSSRFLLLALPPLHSLLSSRLPASPRTNLELKACCNKTQSKQSRGVACPNRLLPVV